MAEVPEIPTKELLNGNLADGQHKIVQGRRDALGRFLEEMDRLANPGLPPILGVDGLAGAGKGGTLRKLAKMDPTMMEKAVVFELDWFIGTERGSKERATVAENGYGHFEAHYMRRELMYQSLVELIDIVRSQRAGVLTIENAYSREGDNPGHFNKKQVEVPEGPSLIVVEGVSATRLLKELEEKEELKAWKMVIWAKTKRALFKAALRDRQKRDKPFLTSYRAHAKQYPLLIQMLSSALDDADIICDRNNGFENYWQKLTKTTEKKALILKVMQEIIQEIGEEGLATIFPSALPENLEQELKEAA